MGRPQQHGMTPQPHAVMIPFPGQGHVIPLMKLARVLSSDRHGFDITFVNTDYVHAHVAKAAAAENGSTSTSRGRIRLVSVPDGLGPNDNRNDLGRLTEAMKKVMSAAIEQLIRRLADEGCEVTCILADVANAWVVEVGARTGVPTGVFCPTAASLLASFVSVSRLMQEGHITADGSPLKQESFLLAPGMPPMNASNFCWLCLGSPEAQRTMFQYILDNDQYLKRVAFTICNSFPEIEGPALNYMPHVAPIGPLLDAGDSVHDESTSVPVHFCSPDSSCKVWLDMQRDRSVVYLAFGTTTDHGLPQLRELALGLELSGRPFLWVIRRPVDVTDELKSSNNAEAEAFLHEFVERVGGRGRVVEWAPQEEVLAHPAVACFVSHCGWNSALEAICNGVPLLCWPSFCDQFLNRDYICDQWKVGLRLEADSIGLVNREEFGKKLDELLADGRLRDRVVNLKDKALNNVKRGGLSWTNLSYLVQELKRGKYSVPVTTSSSK